MLVLTAVGAGLFGTPGSSAFALHSQLLYY